MPSTMWSLYCHQALGESPQDWGQGPAPLPCLFMDVNIQPEDRSDHRGSQARLLDCHLFSVLCALSAQDRASG